MTARLNNIFNTIVDLLFPRYTLVGRFNGHQNAITAISVSPGGVLASGGTHALGRLRKSALLDVILGYDGIKLWQLPDGRRLDAPSGGQGLRGPVSALAWTQSGGADVLVYGTAGGYLSMWRALNNVRHLSNSTRFSISGSPVN